MNNQEYAGFWVRFGALCIDVVIMIIIFGIPLSYIYGPAYWLGTEWFHGFWDVLLGYVIPITLSIWMWVRFFGTPGKMALKLKIVDARTGNRLTLGQAIGRYFAYIPAMLPLGLGLIWVGIDEKKQGWHDKLAGTVVIKSNEVVPVKFDG